MLADGTLTAVDKSGWPAIPGYARPQSPMTTYRLDFGPEWSKGIVTKEPPGIGKPFVGRVPAVDEAGNDRAGIRLPEIAVPLATHTGWNYRRADDRRAGSTGQRDRIVPAAAAHARGSRNEPATAANRSPSVTRASKTTSAVSRSRPSRWSNDRFLLAEDVPATIERAKAHYEWATR